MEHSFSKTSADASKNRRRVSLRNANSSDAVLILGLYTAALVTGIIVVFITVFLFSESTEFVLRTGVLSFFTDTSWHPTSGEYNMTPMLAGTLLAALGAVMLATPLGVLSAVFCHFYAPWPVAALYIRTIELLAGIPSVVYGFWGLVVLVPLISRLHPPGSSLIAGVLILAIMILPTIALLTYATLKSIPDTYLKGATALGLPRYATLRHVVLPIIKSGLFSAVLLGVCRAIGETMAILMVSGNIVQLPSSVFDPIRTLTANIALEMAYATDDHRSALFVSGLLLMVLVTMLIVLADWMSREKIYE